MTDDTHHLAGAEGRSDDHQHARKTYKHAIDALHDGDLSRARSLLAEARTAVERAQRDDNSTQEQCEVAWDCYA